MDTRAPRSGARKLYDPITDVDSHWQPQHDFLVCEDAGRSPGQTSRDVMSAGFLSSRFDSPLHEMANRAYLTELDKATFAFTQGARIPADEVSGMAFWWLK